VYEETAMLAPGHPLFATGGPLDVELGPGLLGRVFDGIQRPLEDLAAASGSFLSRGQRASALDRTRTWPFEPRLENGAAVAPGAIAGVVRETAAIEHRVLIPPGVSGELIEIAAAGSVGVDDPIGIVRGPDGGRHTLRMLQRWRVRVARPVDERLRPERQLFTGQRVLDCFLPLPHGGAVGMPGGFGTGKTVMQQELCKWADADVIVYVGCGERGNEMTEMLRKLPELRDPRTGRPLSERTILVANTSNMPVPAREASIYTGITMAEYYRDMGYRVLVLADSTSRWAEALREVSGRLGEMPAEEGYPSYLASRLAAFYERAGHVRTLGGRQGSVTIISAISPSGGDVTEPVTRQTQRFTRAFWTLDKAMAEARIFPAINLRDSYSHTPRGVDDWWRAHISEDWPALRQSASDLLDEAEHLEATARLIGTQSLPERQQFLLRAAAVIQEGFLQQNAMDDRDAYCSPARQHRLLQALIRFEVRGLRAIDAGVSAAAVAAMPVVAELERAKSSIPDGAFDRFDALERAVDAQCGSLESAVTAGAAP
jgi:V/A-type H+-transporting ATPase subunit A